MHPKIFKRLGGWSKQTIGENYGEGYRLKLLKGWLDKVVFL